MAQLYFYYSAMNAGKSTSLLQSAHNYREHGMEVLLFTASVDDRYGNGVIQSRIGLSAQAEVFGPDTDFITVIKVFGESMRSGGEQLACILVDEAQFLTEKQVNQLAMVVDVSDIPVLCYGLRTDFQGELFSGSARLLAIADKLTELKTVCNCGRKATMTVRLDEQGRIISAGDQIEIGGNDQYESKCRKHHQVLLEQARSLN